MIQQQWNKWHVLKTHLLTLMSSCSTSRRLLCAPQFEMNTAISASCVVSRERGQETALLAERKHTPCVPGTHFGIYAQIATPPLRKGKRLAPSGRHAQPSRCATALLHLCKQARDF